MKCQNILCETDGICQMYISPSNATVARALQV